MKATSETLWGGECKGELGCAEEAHPINQWRAMTELTTREQTRPKPRPPRHPFADPGMCSAISKSDIRRLFNREVA
jgi:hypothetical protein